MCDWTGLDMDLKFFKMECNQKLDLNSDLKWTILDFVGLKFFTFLDIFRNFSKISDYIHF